MVVSNIPLVSVCMITYNHEHFIKQAIEGILMQQADFDIEFIIADDFSTDQTEKIIKKLIKSQPNNFFIKYIRHKGNIGMMPNLIFALQQCNGKYISLCEGDDYWTDPLKLQKQVDFLEINKDYGICFHNTKKVNTLHEMVTTNIPGVLTDTDYSIHDYIMANKTATCSIVFRRRLFKIIPEWYFNVPFGDLALVIAVLKNSKNKKGMVLKDSMAVYRMHDAGVHGSLHKNPKSLILAYKQILLFDKIIQKELLNEHSYKSAFRKKKLKTYTKLFKLAKQEHSRLQYSKYKLLWYVQLVISKLKG